ncbi:DUF411 domain-containing protein [Pseudomonas sp. RIT-PI-S]|uniref:DUF411 domain-containing protein n=1 Tax=Pseudomonas sp. RIT-PI-S TaxID=3035295 RepID=UPI0021D85AE5|nr:DUF411 domain-containing protein [Pseudomonas sp. RIT-PI-S]
MNTSRPRTFGGRFLLLAAFVVPLLAHAAPATTIDVHRDANCGCCSKWIAYLKDNGFQVNDHVEENMSAVKARLGVPGALASCHTGVVNGKFVEGHVPAQEITELARRTDLVGVAAPGMPMGSPGMEVPGHANAYQVLGLTHSGETQVVADYPAR